MKNLLSMTILFCLLTGVSVAQDLENYVIGDFEYVAEEWPMDPNWAPYADGWEVWT